MKEQYWERNKRIEKSLERNPEKVLKYLESMSPDEAEKRKYLFGERIIRLLHDGSQIDSKRLKDGSIIDIELIKRGHLKPKVKAKGEPKDNLPKQAKQKKDEKEKSGVNKSKLIVKKINDAQYPIDILRTSPFFPINKVSKNSKIYASFIKNKNILKRQTQYGSIETRNRLLTQYHKTILDVITTLSFYKNKTKEIQVLPNNSAEISFSLYAVVKKLGLMWNGITRQKIIDTLKEIADTAIVIQTNNQKSGIMFHIIEDIKWRNDGRCQITLSQEYINYFYANLALSYKERLDELIAIKGKGSGLIKSIISFFITHKIDVTNDDNVMRIGFDKLMVVIGYPVEEARMRQRATEYINTYKEKLSEFGISYLKKEKIFIYEGTNGIEFVR